MTPSTTFFRKRSIWLPPRVTIDPRRECGGREQGSKCALAGKRVNNRSRGIHTPLCRRCLCGRDAGYLAPPAQSRTCSFPASGSAVGLTSAQGGCSSIHAWASVLGHVGALYGDCVQQLGEALPAAAPPFSSTPIEPLKSTFRGPVKEAREGVGVALDSIVAIVTSQPRIETVEEGCSRHMPIRLNPCLDPSAHTL
jgi:hypothetical protein